MTAAVALLDANVLYSATLRDLLLQISFNGLFRARWSDQIEREWQRNLMQARPELEPQIERTRLLMQLAIPDALVTHYQHLISELTLPYPDDRHVLAAAIAANADVIVTFNLKDFPASALQLHGMVAQHPDVFFSALIGEALEQILHATEECVGRLRRPPITAAQYIEALRRLELHHLAAFLIAHQSHWETRP